MLGAAAAALAHPLTACASSSRRGAAFHYDLGGDRIESWFAPAHTEQSPLALVLHGNWGLPDDVVDAAELLAAHGFSALAVNPTSREPDHTRIPRALLQGRGFGDRYVEDARAGVAALHARHLIQNMERLAVWGYCGGGYVGLLWASGVHGSELGALVGAHVGLRNRNEDGSFYDTRPHGIDLVRASDVPMQFHFGEADDVTPADDVRELRTLALEPGRSVEIFTYPGATHGFAMHTDAGYEPRAASEFERRGLGFLRERLSAADAVAASR